MKIEISGPQRGVFFSVEVGRQWGGGIISGQGLGVANRKPTSLDVFCHTTNFRPLQPRTHWSLRTVVIIDEHKKDLFYHGCGQSFLLIRIFAQLFSHQGAEAEEEEPHGVWVPGKGYTGPRNQRPPPAHTLPRSNVEVTIIDEPAYAPPSASPSPLNDVEGRDKCF